MQKGMLENKKSLWYLLQNFKYNSHDVHHVVENSCNIFILCNWYKHGYSFSIATYAKVNYYYHMS